MTSLPGVFCCRLPAIAHDQLLEVAAPVPAFLFQHRAVVERVDVTDAEDGQWMRIGRHRQQVLDALRVEQRDPADADIFAFPSFHESFPLSILEALAAGLPIAATDVGGVADAVTEGDGGYLVPPRDAGAMQSALRRLISDPPLRARMGAWNRRRYEESFTVTAFGKRWAEWLKADCRMPPCGNAQHP